MSLGSGCSQNVAVDERSEALAYILALVSQSTAGEGTKSFPHRLEIEANLKTDEVLLSGIVNYIEQNPNYTSFQLLLLLHRCSESRYLNISKKTRLEVLCSYLEQPEFDMSDWNYLACDGPIYDDIAAQELVKLGRPALPRLLELLIRKDYAKYSIMSANYSDARVCDLAYRYTVQILQRQPAYPCTEAERDKAIDGLKNELSTLDVVRHKTNE